MKYTIHLVDDDNLDIRIDDGRQVGYGIFSYAMNEWYIYVQIGIPLNHLENILAEIKKLRG